MAQLISNGVDTTLAANLLTAGTSATLADGSALSTPTGDDYELVTLIASGAFEIVKVTARSGDTITIERAQESTAAQEWPIGTRVVGSITAGTVQGIIEPNPVRIGDSSVATGTNSLAIGVSATATAAESVSVGDGSKAVGDVDNTSATAFGRIAWAEGDYGVAVGYDAWSAKLSSVAVGSSAYSEERWGVAVGINTRSKADYATVVGGWSEADATSEAATVVGPYSYAYAAGATVLGAYSVCYGANCVALGATYIPATAERVFQVEALPAVPKSYSGSQTNAAYRMVGCQSVIMSQPLDLTATATHTIPVPSGSTFFPEEVGVIVTAADTVSGQPTLRFGITGDETKFLAATATTGLAAAHDRHRFTTLASDAGAKTLRAEITVAGAGTTLTGRIYWKGFAVVDS